MSGINLSWREGALRWPNGAAFVMPKHVRVSVGEHVKGWNKTIGRTIDGAKKRFWFGKGERAEAERKAAHLLNCWELLCQRDGAAAAHWDEKTLRLATLSCHIDALISIDNQMTAAASSLASDLSSAQLVNRNGPVAQREPSKAAMGTGSVAVAPTLYRAIDDYCDTLRAKLGASSYQRRQLETLADLKRFRPNCPLTEVDRVWMEQLTDFIKSRPKSKRTGAPIAPATVKTYLQHWRQFFDWLDSNSEGPRFGGWEGPKKWERLFDVELSALMTKRERDGAADGPEQISVSEIAALLKHASDDRQRMLLLAALFTGQGQKELSVTRRDEFDLSASIFKHRRNKTGQLGVYWLPRELVALLADYFAANEPIGDNLAFATSKGTPLVTDTSDSVRQWFDDLRGRARADDGKPLIRDSISFYSLRRYFGHRAREIGGSDLQEAALAHSAKSVGQKHYSNFRDYGRVAEVGRAIYAELKAAGVVFSETAAVAEAAA